MVESLFGPKSAVEVTVFSKMMRRSCNVMFQAHFLIYVFTFPLFTTDLESVGPHNSYEEEAFAKEGSFSNWHSWLYG